MGEPKDSGYVNPRQLVSAQVQAAEHCGCSRVQEEVEEVQRLPSGGFELRLASGATVDARRVLVAAGAFCNARPLLPGVGTALQLDVSLYTAQTVQFALSEDDAFRLKGMPSVICKTDDVWAYILPPIRYPDGSVRLKLGGARCTGGYSLSGKVEMSLSEVPAWYRSGGRSADAAEMEALLHSFVPGLKPLAVFSDSCITCHTPTTHPYIGDVAPGLTVATGGNGFAAKSSDELGRLGATAAMSDSGWGANEDLQREIFLPRCYPAGSSTLISQSWTDVADDYDRNLVPRFAPWTNTALDTLGAHAASLPPGAVYVPCCGPGQELPLVAALVGDRSVLGVDLSSGMIARARERARVVGPNVSAVVGDAAAPQLPQSSCAAVLSVFGLQQLPDRVDALVGWYRSLAPGGIAVVVYWPPSVEDVSGPWGRYDKLLQERLGLKNDVERGNWVEELSVQARAAGAEVLEDCELRHEIHWSDLSEVWDVMSSAGPWHATKLRRGEEFMGALRSDFLNSAERASPVVHVPCARKLVLRSPVLVAPVAV